MKRLLLSLLLAFGATASHAALGTGAQAPTFAADAALAGKPFRFDLKEALKKGPVVLYFYPKAFTPGCTVEAHLFAESMTEFRQLGATVVGMSGDDIDTLKRFSVSECKSRFPVAADPGLKVAKQYDAELASHPGHASRTSYVIAPDGKILSVVDERRPEPHIQTALKMLKKWQAEFLRSPPPGS